MNPALDPPPAAAPATAQLAAAIPAVAAAAVAKRRPGRPAKLKPDAVQLAVPVFPPPVNDVPVYAPDAQPTGNIPPENGATASAPVRGRGRPPKQGGAKRGPGRPPKSGVTGVSSGRGRPRKNPAPVMGAGRPRGRPPKPINVVEGFAPAAPLSGGVAAAPVVAAPPAVAPLAGKRRGRPPKAGNEVKKAKYINAALPKTPRKLSGKPLGRPRKNSEETGNQSKDSSQLLVAYLDLKAKLENLQAMVKRTVIVVRPALVDEAAVNAILELELQAMNDGAPPSVVPVQQQPLPEQVQPQC